MPNKNTNPDVSVLVMLSHLHALPLTPNISWYTIMQVNFIIMLWMTSITIHKCLFCSKVVIGPVASVVWRGGWPHLEALSASIQRCYNREPHEAPKIFLTIVSSHQQEFLIASACFVLQWHCFLLLCTIHFWHNISLAQYNTGFSFDPPRTGSYLPWGFGSHMI